MLALANDAADAAARVIRAAEPRRASLNWQEKSAVDFVTEVDIKAEAAAIEVIRRAEPGAAILAEESGASNPLALQPSSPLTFVLDPLDGTTNFLHGFPAYAVSLGVLLDGVLTAGVVFDVARNERFTAVAGGGAWLGDERISVSRISSPQRALIGTGFPFKVPDEIPRYLAQFQRVMAAASGVRRPGSASIDLAHVACGRFDAFWEISLAPWDVAAGI
ncbi:MAG TPA: inositol monophosphatase family protein, partial [Gemmatimonadaceae bacterium]|nr:inositol monophosphatase family protein [Gemmatimonadaceae bacterium]